MIAPPASPHRGTAPPTAGTPASHQAHPARARHALASRWLLPSIGDLVFLGGLLATLRRAGVMLSADGDPARHLAVGQYILSTGAIPRFDVFSHTRGGAPFVPYEWLAEVMSAALYALGGLAGVVLLHGGAIALTIALLYAHLRRHGNAVLPALGVTLLAGAVSAVHWLARPHVFTMLLAAVYVIILDRWYRSGRHRALWLLPALMVVWANLHGGFLVGLILTGIYLAADLIRVVTLEGAVVALARARLRQLWKPGALTFLAPLLNPAGPELAPHVLGYFRQRSLVDLTVEYQAPSLHDATVVPFFAMLALTAGALAWTRRRPNLNDALLAGVFAYFALFSSRNIPLFAIVCAPILTAALSDLSIEARLNRHSRAALTRAGAWLAARNAAYGRIERRAAGGCWPALVCLALLAGAGAAHRAGFVPLGMGFDATRQPVEAVAYLKSNPPTGNGFNDMVWGGYLLHTLWPAQHVFIDGQTDFYGEALVHEYLRVMSLAPGWQEVMDRYAVTWVLCQTDSLLARQLAGTGDWRVVYADSLASVLVRR